MFVFAQAASLNPGGPGISTNTFSNHSPYAPSLPEFNSQNERATAEYTRKWMEQLGHPVPPTQKQIQTGLYYQRIAEQQRLKEKDLYEAVHSGHSPSKKASDPRLRIADTALQAYRGGAPHYFRAAGELNRMLSGETSLNLKQAVFLVENAYYGGSLNYQKYQQRIDTLVWACRQTLQNEGLSSANYAACHYVIQRLFSDTIFFTVKGRQKRLPISLKYNFADIWGEKDYAQQFVSKLLQTKKGQCHSLPLLYLILAQELNIPANLALAPNHSFVQFRLHNQWYNFETTCGRLVSFDWLAGSGYISSFAIRNKIYLSPLQPKELIAQCLVDLSLGYVHKYGYDGFVLNCAQAALLYWPAGISAMQVIANTGIAYYAKTAEKYHFPPQQEYDRYPELKERFDFLVRLEMQIEQTGYTHIPPEAYEKWQKSANEERNRRFDSESTQSLKNTKTPNDQ